MVSSSSSASTAYFPSNEVIESSKDEDPPLQKGSLVADVEIHHSRNAPTSPSLVVSMDKQDATRLTDELLKYTRNLMDGSAHHMIAYSGGIDSSVVAALVHRSKRRQEETATAVLGISPAVPADQIALAEQVAKVIGIPLEQVQTTEGSDVTYIENSGQACLACKTHLYTCLEMIAGHHTNIGKRLYNGTNADDRKDPTRLGLIAADRFAVQSPLQYMTKEEVRIVGRHLGLPNWNYAASPCLRSRLAIGVEAIPQHLYRIETAEKYIRQWLDLDATRNLRVRLLHNDRAMIEVEEVMLEDAMKALNEWRHFFQEELQFQSVAVRPFKSGSVAKVVPATYDPSTPSQRMSKVEMISS